MAKKTSPTQRTLAHLRKHGWTVAVTERWNAFAKIRQDLFGCIDLVAIHPELGIMGVQATSYSNLAARETKSRAIPALQTWMRAGGRFSLYGWKQLPNGRWEPRCVELSLGPTPESTMKGLFDRIGVSPG